MYYFTITHEINWCSSITIIYFYHINSYIYLSLNQTGLRDSVNVFSQISLYKSNSGIRIGEFDLKVVSVWTQLNFN